MLFLFNYCKLLPAWRIFHDFNWIPLWACLFIYYCVVVLEWVVYCLLHMHGSTLFHLRWLLNSVAWTLPVILFNIFLSKIYFLKILKKQTLQYCQTDNPIASYALNSNNDYPIKQYLHSIKTYGIIPWQRNKEKEEPCIFQLGLQTEAVMSPWQRGTGKRTSRRPWHKSTAEIQSLKGWWHVAWVETAGLQYEEKTTAFSFV